MNLGATPQQTRRAMSDVRRLAACLPKCRAVTLADGGRLSAQVTADRPLVSLPLAVDGRVERRREDDIRLSVRGRAHTVSATLRADLTLDWRAAGASGAETRPRYALSAHAGGKLASVGASLARGRSEDPSSALGRA